LTAMRNGVYALLAVVVGVMLVGMLPGQLSNLATPTVETTTFQSTSKATAENSTLAGVSPSRQNDTVNITGDAATSASTAGTTSSAASTEGTSFALSKGTYDPYADVKYYGFWGVGLVAALAVYFVAKRNLG